jgi:hypothetical protein
LHLRQMRSPAHSLGNGDLQMRHGLVFASLPCPDADLWSLSIALPCSLNRPGRRCGLPTSYIASRAMCEEPNRTVIATGLPLCRPPRSARRSESSSSVAPFAKMNESARSSNTAVTRLCPKRRSWIVYIMPIDTRAGRAPLRIVLAARTLATRQSISLPTRRASGSACKVIGSSLAGCAADDEDSESTQIGRPALAQSARRMAPTANGEWAWGKRYQQRPGSTHVRDVQTI